MKNHLLSIFPLRESAGYARVYLTPLSETGVPSRAPFLITREELAVLLYKTTIYAATRHTLETLDTDNTVQISVSDEDALIIISAP